MEPELGALLIEGPTVGKVEMKHPVETNSIYDFARTHQDVSSKNPYRHSYMSGRVHQPVPKVQITLSDDQLRLVELFRGKMGDSQATIVRNIVLAWLAEKSFISDSVKAENKGTFKWKR